MKLSISSCVHQGPSTSAVLCQVGPLEGGELDMERWGHVLVLTGDDGIANGGFITHDTTTLAPRLCVFAIT